MLKINIKINKNLKDFIIYNNRKTIINIQKINKNYIRNLNRTYKKKNNQTDVLTFKSKNKNVLICDIMIFLKEKTDYTNQILHSIFHLLDYDHIKNKDYKIMNKIEKKLHRYIGMSGIEPPTITTSK
jgi:probable rRNA maturation factor